MACVEPVAGRGAAPPPRCRAAQRPRAVGATAVSTIARAEERAQALAAGGGAGANRCERCELSRGRTNVVFASGDPNADLMIIGEGPGAQEDRQGLPFVGPAGELLTKILLAIERSRDQVYIANIVKCRPPQNRDPRPEEVAACRPYLDQQIALVQAAGDRRAGSRRGADAARQRLSR